MQRFIELVTMLEPVQPQEAVLVDSVPVDGAGQVLDSYNLLAGAVRQGLRRLALCTTETVDRVAKRLDLERYVERGIKGKFPVDWETKEGPRLLLAQLVRWEGQGAARVMQEIPGSELSIPCDLLLLALGFTGPDLGARGALVEELGLKRDPRGNLATDERCMSSVPGVYVAGDARRGQSLVVWAIAEGRRAAREIDSVLSGGAG